jgi:hypothetical protein
MKKIIASTLLLLSFSGTAFAATLATNTPSAQSLSIFGGIDTATAQAAANPLIKLSNKVSGIVNFTTGGSPLTSPGYAIGTKHNSGTKYFGTANDSTTIYWKLDAAGVDIDGTKFGTAANNNNFSAAGKWTAY